MTHKEDIKTITDIIHKTIYGFFDVCDEEEETPITDKDELLLKVNKALCNNIKALEQEQSGDAISRQAVLESIKNLYPDMPVMDIMGARRKWLEKFAPYFECENAIEQLPPVTPQPKVGHWIEHKYNGVDYIECSNCFVWFMRMHLLRNSYCPNCGQKMLGSRGQDADSKIF